MWRFPVARSGASDADDCFQETFLAALRAYPRCGRPNLRAWVLTIAHRKALDHLPRPQRRAVPVEELPEVAAPPRACPTTASGPVRALPPKQRAAVPLRFAGDLATPSRRGAGLLARRPPGAVHEGLKKLDRSDRMTRRPSSRSFDRDAAAAAAARFADRAGRRVLRVVDSPVGPLVPPDRSAASSAWPTRTSTAASTPCSSTSPSALSPRILEAPAQLDDVRRELDEYFAGRRTIRPAARLVASPPSAARCCRRPRGSPSARSTYGAVAAPAGNAGRPRGGQRARRNPIPIVVPCHRVVGTERQAHRLHRRAAPQGGAPAPRGRGASPGAPSALRLRELRAHHRGPTSRRSSACAAPISRCARRRHAVAGLRALRR